MQRTAQGLAADLAAAVSGTGAVASWIATANDILQLAATTIAIIAGISAYRYHRVRRLYYKEKLNEQSNGRSSGPAPRASGGQSSGRTQEK